MPRYLFPFALIISVFAVACSTPEATGNSPSAGGAVDTAKSAASAESPSPGSAKSASPGRAIGITASDDMKFSVTEIKAKPGEPLSVTLTNVGTTPKFSMGHNWLLLALGTDSDQFVVTAAEAVTTDYVPAQKDRILAATKLLGPKESNTVTFTAPNMPGRYPFLCSFPGHYQVGMRGVLIVE
jgi:azurin